MANPSFLHSRYSVLSHDRDGGPRVVSDVDSRLSSPEGTRTRPDYRSKNGSPGVAQPGGQEDRRRPAGPRPAGGAAAGDAGLPAGRRAGDLAARVPPGGGAEHGRDGAGRGGRHRGARWTERLRAAQRHAHPLRGWRVGVGGRHPPGHDGPGGAGAAAGRVPRDGEPRAADAAHLHQGLVGSRAGFALR